MRFPSRSWRKLACQMSPLLVIGRSATAYDLDAQSTDSIKDIAGQMAGDLVSMYNGNKPGGIPGLLPDPYYWWEGGAFMGALIDYWYYTGDDAYNDITTQGLLHQIGPESDYMPPNQTLTEGNDDQGFWGMAVMSAAEYKFPDPPEGQPQWLALAQAVFNTQAKRWDTEHCNGGLRWQIFTWNNGYNYKNAISQACFFNIAARLALYTGNSTYADWAVRTWDWMEAVKMIDEGYRVYDGAHIEDNCSVLVPYEFSYNVGAFLLGAAAMGAYSNGLNQAAETDMWRERVDGLLNATELIFFFGNDTNDKVMIEIACEPVNLCNVDQQSFKAYLSRWMAVTTKWAPWTFDRIKRLLSNSAQAAARQCTGGDNGRMCGLKWANNSGVWDGSTGVGQQMAAMEVILANMIEEAEEPATSNTGGTSQGDPSAGGSNVDQPNFVERQHGPIRDGDRAGAIIVTIVLLSTLFFSLMWLMSDEEKSTSENWGSFRSSLAATQPGAAVIVRGGAKNRARASADQKGKGMLPINEESSSTSAGSAEKVADLPLYGGGLPAVRFPEPVAAGAVPGRHSSQRKRLSKSRGNLPGDLMTSANSTASINGRHSVAGGPNIGPRASILKKQRRLST